MIKPRCDVAVTEHTHMLVAIENGDLEGLLTLCNRHNEGTKQAVRDSLNAAS